MLAYFTVLCVVALAFADDDSESYQ